MMDFHSVDHSCIALKLHSSCWCVPPYHRDLRRLKTDSPSARSLRYKPCLLINAILLHHTALRSGFQGQIWILHGRFMLEMCWGTGGLEMKKVTCFHFDYTCFTQWHIPATVAWKTFLCVTQRQFCKTMWLLSLAAQTKWEMQLDNKPSHPTCFSVWYLTYARKAEPLSVCFSFTFTTLRKPGT